MNDVEGHGEERPEKKNNLAAAVVWCVKYPKEELLMSLLISEIFASIQGESSRAGLPCIFIRLAGCNLKCRWCDTTYAEEGGSEKSINTILEAVGSWKIRLVEITGGEPLYQPECSTLAQQLLQAGYTVLVETNGSQPIAQLPDGVIRIMDIKCPDSGMADHFYSANVEALTEEDEIKFVLASRRDYEYGVAMIRQYRLDQRCRHLFFSPVLRDLPAAQLAEWMLADLPPARLHLQLHTVIWPGVERGV